jgi:SSS family solute:Na+ symporter
MAVGTFVTLGTMFIVPGGVMANEPIYFGLAASLAAYVIVSLVTPRTPASVLKIWNDRLAGRAELGADAAEPDAVVPATSPGEPLVATRPAAE